MLKQQEHRQANWQLRLADKITTFAGSMIFVWVHCALFAFWIAPADYASTDRVASLDYSNADPHFDPFLAHVPPNAHVQLQVPMDLDGKRVTYTFTFQPST